MSLPINISKSHISNVENIIESPPLSPSNDKLLKMENNNLKSSSSPTSNTTTIGTSSNGTPNS
jgi:hypothetical protein